MSIRINDLALPVISSDKMLLSGGGYHSFTDTHLIINTIITTLIFLNILLIFTLIFNIETRSWQATDFQFFLFLLAFSIFNFTIIPILIFIKN